MILDYLKPLPGSIVHLVFDDYSEDPDYLYPSKDRKETGMYRVIADLSQKLPKISEWGDFLSNRRNKYQLTQLIAEFLISDKSMFPKNLFVTKGKYCYYKEFNQPSITINELSSNHIEADQRLVSHLIFASREFKTVCVVADDTDVYVICLFAAKYCNGYIYFRQGTTNSKDGITYHDITAFAIQLGQSLCDVLPFFHVLTGSDYTYPFHRRTKVQAFKKMCSKPQSMNLLQSLGTVNANIHDVMDFILHIIYNRPKNEKTPGESRYKMLFVGKGKSKKFRATKLLPPDQCSLDMKIMRTNFVSYNMASSLTPIYTSLDAKNYGWEVKDEILQPIWFLCPPLPSDEEISNHLKENDTNNDDDFDDEDDDVNCYESSEEDSDDEDAFPWSDEDIDDDSDIE